MVLQRNRCYLPHEWCGRWGQRSQFQLSLRAGDPQSRQQETWWCLEWSGQQRCYPSSWMSASPCTAPPSHHLQTCKTAPALISYWVKLHRMIQHITLLWFHYVTWFKPHTTEHPLSKQHNTEHPLLEPHTTEHPLLKPYNSEHPLLTLHRTPTPQTTHHRTSTPQTTHHRTPTPQTTPDRTPIPQTTHHRTPTPQTTHDRTPTLQTTHHRTPTPKTTTENPLWFHHINLIQTLNYCKPNPQATQHMLLKPHNKESPF